MSPGVDALAERHRVLTFSLGDAAGDDSWFDRWVRLDRQAGLDDAGLEVGDDRRRLVRRAHRDSLRGATADQRVAPARPGVDTVAAALAWNARQELHLRHPLLTFPLFLAGAIGRVSPEIFAARPRWTSRLQLGAEYGWRTVRGAVQPAAHARMGARLDVDRPHR